MSKGETDIQGKKVLFIAYFFPPVISTNVPGAMRTIKFLRNLTNGEFHVLTTIKLIPESESSLSHISLPVNSEIIHRVKSWDLFKLLLIARDKFKKIFQFSKASESQSKESTVFCQLSANDTSKKSKFQGFKDFISDIFYFPDQAGPWILPASIRGFRIVKDSKIDLVFATGSPWSALLTGFFISKLTGKPLIVDFRDPWINNPFHQPKGKLLDTLSIKIEKRIVHHASSVSLNTEALEKEFISRFPKIDRNKFFVLPNGFDVSDFVNIEEDHINNKIKTELVLCHAGFLYGVRDPSVLLNAIAKSK